MRAEWQALHTKLVKSSTTLAFQKDFEGICGRSEVLRSFRDPADLFDRLHAPGDEHLARNAILRALMEDAQSGRPTANTAVILLLLALWLGLDAIHRRLLHHFHEAPDHLVSEISARATRGILTLDLHRVTWIAATLVRNTERDIRRELRAAWGRDALTDEYVEEDDYRSAGTASVLGLQPGLDAQSAIVTITELLREEIGDDAELVVAVAINGERQHEAAQRLGLTPEAARKRYQRAIAKLRNKFPE